jgi:hypothetical protein
MFFHPPPVCSSILGKVRREMRSQPSIELSQAPAGSLFRVYRYHLLSSLLVFLTAGYFYNTRPGWNVHSQFAITCAIVEQGTVQIDRYHEKLLPTEDKSIHDGHVYSDKSPVTAFLAIPAMCIYRFLNPEREHPDYYSRALYWVTWFTIGMVSAAICFLVIELLLRRGCSPLLSSLTGIFWITATPLLGYSALFFNYIPACAMTIAGFYLIDPALKLNDKLSPGRMFTAGLLLGLASWTLNTMALAALVLTLLLAGLSLVDRHYTLRGLVFWISGGILGGIGYFIYSYSVFDTLGSPYQFESDPFFHEQMSRGFMGATHPRLQVAWLVTFHPFRGLFVWWPILTLALGGSFVLAVRGDHQNRLMAICSILLLTGLVIYNSAYFMWWGGYTYAPRHLLPALSLLFTGIVPILRIRSYAVKLLFLLVIGTSMIFNITAVALDPQVPPYHPQEALMHPESISNWSVPYLTLQKYAWGKSPDGKTRGQTDQNWGTLVGLKGLFSLVPLLIIWGGMLAPILYMSLRRGSGSDNQR